MCFRIRKLILGLALLPSPASADESPAKKPYDSEPGVVSTRPLLPDNAWPLSLGRERARQIVEDAVEGRGTVAIPSDELVYYGGGITARPIDALHTSITVNWRMIQMELAATEAAMTPEEAVKSFQQNPKRPVTVEFGVESAGWPDGPIPIDEDPLPPIIADWDGRLSDGGKFSLILTAKAVRGLKDIGIELPPEQPAGLFDTQRLSLISKHLKGKGIHVTGFIKASHPAAGDRGYYIVVDDAGHFAVNK
jgi:hypothetical protein